MNCPKCGAQLLQGASFCGGCGYKLQAATAPVSSAQPGGFAQAHGIHIDEDSRGQGGGYKYEVMHRTSDNSYNHSLRLFINDSYSLFCCLRKIQRRHIFIANG